MLCQSKLRTLTTPHICLSLVVVHLASVLGDFLTFVFIDEDMVPESIGAFQQQLVSASNGRWWIFWPRNRFSLLSFGLKPVLVLVQLKYFENIEEEKNSAKKSHGHDLVFRAMGGRFKERNLEEAEEEDEEEEEEEKTAKELDDEIKRKKERQVMSAKIERVT